MIYSERLATIEKMYPKLEINKIKNNILFCTNYTIVKKQELDEQ